jgi:thiamine-phosphate pyrophosphorylase
VSAALPRLHAVTDDRVSGAAWLTERAALLADAAGPELAVHLRTRTHEGGAFLILARALRAALEPHGSWLVVNDRADVARAAGAHAVVTGGPGLVADDVRRVAPGLVVGRSVHDAVEARAAAGEGADFLIAGAVYETPTHQGERGSGLAVVRAAALTGRPVIAIGGVTPERTPEVIAAGACGVAAIRALWDAHDPAAAARAFLAALPVRGTLTLSVNGEPRETAAGTTIAGLLAQLGLNPRAVVVEHNRRIVRGEGLAEASLAEGDAVEIVHFVGGG